jgi:hypothetical protein
MGICCLIEGSLAIRVFRDTASAFSAVETMYVR